MSTPTAGTIYPFDPTGKLASNLITGDMQAIVPGDQGNSNHFIVPLLAPYFVDSLVALFQDTEGVQSPLVEGVDYVCTHVFHDASLACASRVAGSLSFYNLNLQGQIQLQYQTLGGIWTLNEAAINTILADRLHNPRITTWEQVTDQPVTFPVIDHEWNLVDLVGMSEILAELQNIEAVLRDNSSSGLAAHIADHENPHFTTQDQVGLGLVMNYAMAVNADAVAGVRSDLYMAPSTTLAAITAAIAEIPPGAIPTAAQVGAYSFAQTDALLTDKLDTDAQAADSLLFAGQTPADFTTTVLAGTAANATNAENASQFGGQTPSAFTASVLSGTAANAAEFGGLTPAAFLAQVVTSVEQSIGDDLNFAVQQEQFIASDASPNLWTQLTTSSLPQPTDPANSAFTDAQLLVTGGDSFEVDTLAGVYMVRLSVRGGSVNPVSLSVANMAGVVTGAEFGYVLGTDGSGAAVAQLWVKTKGNRNSMYVTSLNVKGATILASQTAVDAEPAGIVYATEDALVYASDIVESLTNLTTAVSNLTTLVTGE